MNAETDKADAPGDDEEARGRILVIDDEEGIHLALRRILGRQGHEVDAVFSATEGLGLLETRRYDLIITDLMMPEVNGIQLLERVRELGLKVPVMMITGYPSMRTAVQALRLGAVDYLAKPFTRQELLGPLNRILRGPRLQFEEEEALAEAPGEAAAREALAPGVRFHLRKHSWAVYESDGTVRVGIEASFLASAGSVISIELPHEADQIEQGFTGIRLKTSADEEHGVFMPLSGQVVSVNTEALSDPGSIEADTWLIHLLPANLDAELANLARG